jgi:pyridoxal phosphate enzyme (YggS family)
MPMPKEKDAIARRWSGLTQELATYAHGPVLVAVSKTRSLPQIRILYDLGQRHFGENRVEELEEKAHALTSVCPDIHWHFIGNYQSNKLARLLKIPAPLTIHSLASSEHVAKFLKKIQSEGRPWPLNFLLQVNTAREDEKSGFDPASAELEQAIAEIAASGAAGFLGLMTMARLRSDDREAAARLCFAELAQLVQKYALKYPKLQWKTSMGMSGDFRLGLQCGAHYIRVGSLLFED